MLETGAYDREDCIFSLKSSQLAPDNPITYWLSSIDNVEQAYDTIRKESLAKVLVILQSKQYLEGVRFKTWTNHGALHWILKLTDKPGKIVRWHLRQSEFEFEVLH